MSSQENEKLTTNEQETLSDSSEYVIPEKRERKSGRRFADSSDNYDNETDYVIGSHGHSSHHHHHHHSHSDDEYVFSKHDYHRKKSKKSVALKALLTVLIVLLAVIVATGTTYVVLRQIGESQMHNYEEMELALPDDSKDLKDSSVEVSGSGKTITYEGHTYTLNEKVATVVFIGVDQSMDNSGENMSDAIFITAIDSALDKVTIIPVSRDTMADIDVFSDEGKYIDTEKLQLSYAYSYSGDGKNGAQNTTSALSKLFFGLPFNNYFALDMDAVVTLNDDIGGVPVTSLITFVSPEDGSTIYEGEDVVLHGKEAEYYVRTRDKSELESNNDRMARQQQYIKSFLASVVPAAKSDLSVVTNLYGTITDNSTTSLTLPQITFLASDALSLISDSSDIAYKSIQGEIKEGEHAEFIVDDKALLELMLDVFYIKTA